MDLLPLSHTLPLTMVKQARQTRSSIHSILLALDMGDGCRQCRRTAERMHKI